MSDNREWVYEYCPECGEPTETFNEGVCDECHKKAYEEAYIEAHRRREWQNMTDTERQCAVNDAIRLA